MEVEHIEVFPWNDNFSTGIPKIDEQHKRLVHLLNMLASHAAYQSAEPTLNNILDELTEYTVYHFRTEEGIWRQFLAEDPWEVEHEEMHQDFIAYVENLRREQDTRSLNEMIEDILSFLTHWLALHILENDKRMAKAALAMQGGMMLEQAKQHARREMGAAMKVMIETVLSMYDHISHRTMQLMKEIIVRQRAEAKLRLAANVIENTLEAICIMDADANVIDANPAFCEIISCSAEEVAGRNLKSLKSGLADETLLAEIRKTLADKGHWSGEIQSRAKSGEIYTEWLTLSAIKDEQGVISNYVGVFSNVSHLIRQRHELERVASHDVLTGLPNRMLLSDRLELAIAHAERTRAFLAVCFLDLDGFKPVNDRKGHAAGDVVLQEVAQRLQKGVRGNDTVARLGGDEFVLLLSELKQPDDYRDMLERLLHEAARPIPLEDDNANVTASIGVAIFPQDGDDPDALMRHADHAMYQAKRLGKSRYFRYQATA